MSIFQFGSVVNLLAGTATVAAIIVGQSFQAFALTASEIYEIAVPVTVRVARSSTDLGGSGVIIAKQGNTYTVLTNDHVVCNDPPNSGNSTVRCDDVAYTIHTYDSKQHQVISDSIRRFGNRVNDPDLALVQFSSTEEYPVATLGNSDAVEVYQEVYAFGFPGFFDFKTGRTRQERQAPRGFVTEVDVEENSRGYTLAHDARVWHGLSGSPLFDVRGRVIGINGQARTDTVYAEAFATDPDNNPQTDDTPQRTNLVVPVSIDTGIYLAVPINTFISLLPESGFDLISILDRDNTPAPSIRRRLQNPESAEDFYVRGLIRSGNQDQEDAARDFDRAIELDPEFTKAYYQRAIIQFDQGEAEAAIADFEQVIRLDPEDMFGYYGRGTAQAKLGKFEEAIRDLSRAIELDPSFANAYRNRSAARYQLSDSDGALQDSNRAIELDPNNDLAYNNRGAIFLELGDNENGLKDLNRAIELDPNNDLAYNNRGIIRFRANDYQGALEDYSRAIELDPRDAKTYSYRGNVRSLLGDNRGALEDLNRAIELKPDYASAYNERGLTYFNLSDFERALEDFNRSIELDPNNAVAYSNRGIARINLNDPEGALEDLNRSIELDPNYDLAYSNRSAARTVLDDHEGALQDADRSIELNPNNADAYANRGIAHARLGNRQATIEDFQKAADLFQAQGRTEEYQEVVNQLRRLQ
jgi:tetratricopeptide (TPR) repeat protein/S1-C subfamily serine protease